MAWTYLLLQTQFFGYFTQISKKFEVKMKNNLIIIVTLIFTTTVGISYKTFANPIEKDESGIHKNTEKANSCATLKPWVFYGFALNAPTKSRALENLRKAEECYTQESDKAGIEKVRNKIANIDTIDFAKNRKKFIDSLRRSAENSRRQGNVEEAAKIEAEIREFEQAQN